MMEATNRNLIYRLLILFFIISTLQCPIPIYAQTTPDSRLSQLLDSAEILKLKKEFNDAIEICNNVIADAKEINDWESHAKALNELSDIYRNVGQLLEAKSILDSSKYISDRYLPENNIEEVRSEFYKGKIYRSKYLRGFENCKDSALFCYDLVLKNQKEITDNNCKAAVLLEVAYFYSVIGNLDKSKIYYQQLAKLTNNEFDALGYKRGYYLFYLATHYVSLGDYERSLIFTEIARYIFQHGESKDFSRFIECENQLAKIYFEILNFSKATSQYRKVVGSIKSKLGEFDNSLIDPYTNICQSLININAHDEAIKYASQALNLIDRYPDYTEYEDNLYFLYHNLAEAYEKKQEFIIAENYYHRSINKRIQLHGANHEQVYEGYRYFAEYYQRQGLNSLALEYFKKSLVALYEDFSPKDIYENPNFEDYENTEQLFYVCFGKSETLFKLYNKSGEIKALESSYNLFLETYDLLDKLMRGNYLDKSSIQLFKRFEEGFDLSIECAVKLYEITSKYKYLDQAFQFMEKNKYVLLFKAIVNSSANIERDNSNVGVTEKALSTEIDKIRQQLNDTNNSDSLFELRNKLAEFLVQKDELNIKAEKAKNPSIDSDKKTLGLKKAQDILSKQDELIIEFHWSKNKIYAFVIGKNFTDLYKIKWSLSLERNIEIFSKSISNYSDDTEDLMKYMTSAFYLFNNIFQPLEQIFTEAGKPERIIIVPDGPLSTLPFEAFLSDFDTTAVGYWSLDYLGKEYTMSYAYSLNILEKNLAQNFKDDKPNMLALSYSELLDKNSDIEELRSENELPYSGEEIKKIRERIKATTFLGKKATEDIFKAKASDYSLIHLALHGLADTLDMFNSRLLFKQDPNGIEDGKLRAFELYSLDLSKLEMVVLSACETGIGKQYEGEGIFSIARGFAYAGCPSIVMSLWKVNDKATAKLMDSYYEFISDGYEKDKALQQAKLRYIEDGDDWGAHPSNWASFITLGNNQPVHIPKSSKQWNYLFIVGIALLLVFLFIRRRSILTKV